MNKKISIKFVVLIIGILVAIFFLFIPSSVQTMQWLAFTEFDYFITDNNLDRDAFKGSKILIDGTNLVFVWNAYPTISDTVQLYIQVPSYMIGRTKIYSKGDSTLWQMLKKKKN